MNFEREARRRGLGIHRRRGSIFSRHSWAYVKDDLESVRFEMPLSMWKGDVTQFDKQVSVLMRHTCELLETRRGVVDFGEEMTAYVEEWFEAYTVC